MSDEQVTTETDADTSTEPQGADADTSSEPQEASAPASASSEVHEEPQGTDADTPSEPQGTDADTSSEPQGTDADTSSEPQEASAPASASSDGASDGASDDASDDASDGGLDDDGDEGPVISETVEVGAVIQGQVQRITPYGAFLTLSNGKLGLVHISEIDRNYVKDVHEHLREGDTVTAKVLAIKEDGKIDLSIKALQDPEPRQERRRGTDPGFEQMLRKFMRQSEERQVDVKRSVMNKRK